MRSWKHRARNVKATIRALSLAARDPRVPWHAKAFAALVLAYAVSPLDLIPDCIPVLGHLDDLVLVPLGLSLVIKMILHHVWQECLDRAKDPRE